MGISVRELISSSDAQARGMQLVAQRTDAAASVSLMDLSVEAECFGSAIRVSDEEVPTVVGSIVSTEEEARALAVPPVGAGRTGLYIEAIEKAVGLITDRPRVRRRYRAILTGRTSAGRDRDHDLLLRRTGHGPRPAGKGHTVHHGILQSLQRSRRERRRHRRARGRLLSPALSAEFSGPYVKQIVDAVQDDSFLVIYHNCGNSTIQMIDSILETGSAAYHFGNAIDMAEMMTHIPAGTVAMGNVEPRRGVPERHAGIHSCRHAWRDGRMLQVSQLCDLLRLRYPAALPLGKHRRVFRRRE